MKLSLRGHLSPIGVITAPAVSACMGGSGAAGSAAPEGEPEKTRRPDDHAVRREQDVRELAEPSTGPTADLPIAGRDGDFPTSLSDVRPRRVADVMYEQGYLKGKMNAKSIIVGQTGS